jgi:hypothetical protein
MSLPNYQKLAMSHPRLEMSSSIKVNKNRRTDFKGDYLGGSFQNFRENGV